MEARASLFSFLDLGHPFLKFPLSWQMNPLFLPGSFILEDFTSLLIISFLFDGFYFLDYLNCMYILCLAWYLKSWGDPSILRTGSSCISSEWTDWEHSTRLRWIKLAALLLFSRRHYFKETWLPLWDSSLGICKTSSEVVDFGSQLVIIIYIGSTDMSLLSYSCSSGSYFWDAF